MSSITLKITSLIVRTLSKPIANQIKAQAREHGRFRKVCVSFAQSLHRVDMRLRLGLLRDTAAIERQATKEAAEAQAKKRKTDAKEKAEAQLKTENASEKVKDVDKEKEKEKPVPKARIRPLSEAKAIDTGASFISEAFLFFIGGSLIVFESFRSRRKENTRREDVAERLGELEDSERNARRALVALEKEILRLRAEEHKHPAKHSEADHQAGRILPKEVWHLEEIEEDEDEKKAMSWWMWLKTRRLNSGEGSDLAKDQKQPQVNQDSPSTVTASKEHAGDSKPSPSTGETRNASDALSNTPPEQ
ncbi:MAG: hypothetical protein M1833_002622 [Piccolia ochrophora]|nr:MAG: hypothetical protein M1833_002622 [Piccolia ochrophora]